MGGGWILEMHRVHPTHPAFALCAGMRRCPTPHLFCQCSEDQPWAMAPHPSLFFIGTLPWGWLTELNEFAWE